MRRLLLKGSLLIVSLSLAAAACSSSSSPSSSSSSAFTSTGASLPTAKTVSRPVTYGYYDGHVDVMLSTDVSSKSQAAAQHINYSAALTGAQPMTTMPSLYMISGPAAPHQPVVFGTEPGESDYSPLWDEVTVTWKPGVKPVLLVKDDQIKALAASGRLSVSPTSVVLNCPIVKVG